MEESSGVSVDLARLLVVVGLSGVAVDSSRVGVVMGSSGVAILSRVAVVVGSLRVALGSSWVAGARVSVAVD
jgi:hypothetical protein